MLQEKYSKVHGVGRSISYFPVAVIKYPHKSNFREKSFSLAYSSREATVRGENMVVRAGSWLFTFPPTKRKQEKKIGNTTGL